jgi:hypothetical protein
MLSLAKLLLPALTPSWRFFDSVGPSPRIEYALLKAREDEAADWRELRPRPATSSGRDMLRRLFWNPDGNESLFLTSCAERLLETPTDHSRSEIEARIVSDLSQGTDYMQFRIVLVRRRDTGLVREVAYVSRVLRWREAA